MKRGNLGVARRSSDDGRETPGMVVGLTKVVPVLLVAGATVAQATPILSACTPLLNSYRALL